MRLFQSHALATHWQNDVALPAQLYQSLLAWTSLDPESLQTYKAFSPLSSTETDFFWEVLVPT